MTAPARSPVDDALDRLDALVVYEAAKDALATVREALSRLRASDAEKASELERLREERDAAEKYRQGEKRRREAAEAEVRQLRSEVDFYGDRGDFLVYRHEWDALHENVRRLREGLREAETGFNDISLILEAENDGYQERAYKRAMEEWRHVRALLAANPPQGDAAAGSSPSDGEPCPFCGFQGPFDGHVCEPVLCGCGDPDNCRYATAEEHADSPSGGGGAK